MKIHYEEIKGIPICNKKNLNYSTTTNINKVTCKKCLKLLDYTDERPICSITGRLFDFDVILEAASSSLRKKNLYNESFAMIVQAEQTESDEDFFKVIEKYVKLI